jgi:hypothetical protein
MACGSGRLRPGGKLIDLCPVLADKPGVARPRPQRGVTLLEPWTGNELTAPPRRRSLPIVPGAKGEAAKLTERGLSDYVRFRKLRR